MKTSVMVLMLLALFLVGCTAAPTNSGIVCNAPYIQVGTACCIDQNGNSVCDADEAAPKVDEPPAESSADVAVLTPDAMRLEATNFAQHLARRWEKSEWSEIYKDIPLGEQAIVSEKEFVFFMNITSPYSRAQYDGEFKEALYGGYYTGFKRGQGLKMTVGDVTYNDNSSVPKATTTMSSMTFDNVVLNVRLWDDSDQVVRYDWRPFTFIWEDGRWKVQTIGVYFMGNDPNTVCAATNYQYRCLFEYAKAFNQFEHCDATGYYVAECYSHFKKPLDIDKAVAGCNLQIETTEKDECLFTVMFVAHDVGVCDKMGLQQNKFTCYGIDSGFNKSYEQCWAKVAEADLDVMNNQKAQCIYGYVWATKDDDLCDKMPERSSQELKTKCYDKDFPLSS